MERFKGSICNAEHQGLQKPGPLREASHDLRKQEPLILLPV